MTVHSLYRLKHINVENFPHIHSRSASNLSYLMAKQSGLSDLEASDVRLGAYLHDLGKIAISPKIINKPGPLNKDEWQNIFMHPTLGVSFIESIEPLRKYKDYILYHHERFDGNGYPFGLKGDQIPFSCQIISVADAYHAMTSERPYRKALAPQEALEKIKKGAGLQWNKIAVTLLCSLV